VIPDLAIIDEYHRHRTDALRAIWRDKLTKRQGSMLTISCAGGEDANPLEELREAAHRLPNVAQGRTSRHTITRSDDLSFAMHEHALRADDDPDDLAVVKLANPLAQITLDELRLRHDSPSTRRWQWLRFTCNVRSKGEDSAIPPEVWDAHAEAGLEPDRSAPAFGWVDLGFRIDHAAIGALIWERDDRRVIADVLTLRTARR
jgi:phage terminase large subunit-like protein